MWWSGVTLFDNSSVRVARGSSDLNQALKKAWFFSIPAMIFGVTLRRLMLLRIEGTRSPSTRFIAMIDSFAPSMSPTLQ